MLPSSLIRKQDRDKEKSSSIPPLIPPFLAKLYLKLPHISGPPPDTDAMVAALKSTPLPALDTLKDDQSQGEKNIWRDKALACVCALFSIGSLISFILLCVVRN